MDKIIKSKKRVDYDKVKDNHLVMINFFQYERLVHLIVIMFYVLFTILFIYISISLSLFLIIAVIIKSLYTTEMEEYINGKCHL